MMRQNFLHVNRVILTCCSFPENTQHPPSVCCVFTWLVLHDRCLSLASMCIFCIEFINLIMRLIYVTGREMFCLMIINDKANEKARYLNKHAWKQNKKVIDKKKKKKKKKRE